MKTPLLYSFLIVLFLGCDFDFPDIDIDYSMDFNQTWEYLLDTPDPEFLVELDDSTNLGVIQRAPSKWGKSGDIGNLPNSLSAEVALADFNGEENSRAMLADYVEGAIAECYQLQLYFAWYLPSAGELNLVLEQLRDTLGTGVFWSSTEVDSVNAWGLHYESGPKLIQSLKDSSTNRCLCVRKFSK